MWIVRDKVVKRMFKTKDAISELKILEQLRQHQVKGVIWLEDYFVDSLNFICFVFPILKRINLNTLSLQLLWQQLHVLLEVNNCELS